MPKLVAKNWGEFQHYKDRSPAWIKLHKRLIDDFEFQCLPIASRALAPMLWLLASEEEDGSIDYSPKKLAFRLRTTPGEIESAVKPLVESGFFELVSDCNSDASGLLAQCLPREEKEKEKEKEKEEEKKAQAKPARFDPREMTLPECIKPSAWEAWIDYRRGRKLTCTEATMKAQAKNLEDWWHEGHDPNAIITASISNGWQGLFPPKGGVAAKPVDGGLEANRRLAEMAVKRLNLVGA